MPKDSIYSIVARGKIPPEAVVRIGRCLRFERTKIDEWIDQAGGLKER